MKIYEGIFPPKIDPYLKAKRQEVRGKKDECPTEDEKEGVKVSGFALELGRAINGLGSQQIRTEKVEPISEKVLRGEYQVDEKTLAEEIIKDSVLKGKIMGE